MDDALDLHESYSQAQLESLYTCISCGGTLYKWESEIEGHCQDCVELCYLCGTEVLWDDLTTTCKGIASETERKQAIATNAAACSKTPLVVQVRARSPFSCHIDASSRSRITVVALIAAISPVRTLSATNP